MNSKVIMIIGSLMLGACSTHSAVKSEVVSEPQVVTQVIQAPGVVEYVWEEPMVDVVDVPPGLDPEGHYYRPAHQGVIEVRQGRWKYYRKAEDQERSN